MSRFRKLSHTLWHCNYHIVWTPKYRYRILEGEIKSEVESCLHQFVERQGGIIEELNVQKDHVHLLVSVPPKVSISNFVGAIKGRTSIRVLNKFKQLKRKPYWGNHFWARGYCVDTVGLDEEMIRKYVKYQEDNEKRSESNNK
jgi:putative transposase